MLLKTTLLLVCAVFLMAQGGSPYQIAIDLSLAVTIVVSVPLALGSLTYQRTQGRAGAICNTLVRWHGLFAASALLALLLPETVAFRGLLALPWFLFTVAVAASGVLCSSTYRGAWEIEQRGTDIACVYLAVGGVWFLASVTGFPVMGFQEPIVRLTAVHFHVASFCLVLVSVLLASRVIASGHVHARTMRYALAVHVVSPAIVALGITFSRGLEIVGSLSLVVSWLLIIALTIRAGVLSALGRTSKALLSISFVCVGVTLLLALSYSVFRVPTIPHMALSHGLINAFVVIPAALLALSRSSVPPIGGDDVSLLRDRCSSIPVSSVGWRLFPLIHERYDISLGVVSADAFERIGDLISSYRVYAPQILDSTALFREESRRARAGDRIYQRLHLVSWRGEPLLTLPSLVEVDRAELRHPQRARVRHDSFPCRGGTVEIGCRTGCVG